MADALNGTEGQAEKLNSLSKIYPKTGRSYSIVAVLDCCYACHSMEDAEKAFDGLCSWMRCCRLQPMKDAELTLKRYKDKILAYFSRRITNEICEGINSMIQSAKRKAHGFNTFKGYASIIYLVAGKWKLAVPRPF